MEYREPIDLGYNIHLIDGFDLGFSLSVLVDFPRRRARSANDQSLERL